MNTRNRHSGTGRFITDAQANRMKKENWQKEVIKPAPKPDGNKKK